MKKYQLYFGLALASMLWVNLAQAQFNYAAKKKPATAAKDSVSPKTDNTPAAVTPPAATVVTNPNAKSVKTYDTTLIYPT